MVYLTLYKKIMNIIEFVQLFLKHIVHLYGFFKSIISDRSSVFTSHF